MEKKLKVMAARAESACTRTSAELVAAHWLVRKQKPTNHRKVQRAGETMREEWAPEHVSWAPRESSLSLGPRRDSRKDPPKALCCVTYRSRGK